MQGMKISVYEKVGLEPLYESTHLVVWLNTTECISQLTRTDLLHSLHFGYCSFFFQNSDVEKWCKDLVKSLFVGDLVTHAKLGEYLLKV